MKSLHTTIVLKEVTYIGDDLARDPSPRFALNTDRGAHAGFMDGLRDHVKRIGKKPRQAKEHINKVLCKNTLTVSFSGPGLRYTRVVNRKKEPLVRGLHEYPKSGDKVTIALDLWLVEYPNYYSLFVIIGAAMKL